MAARPDRGFSLLEVLVTLVIFSLLFTVLMSGWYQALRAQDSVAAAADTLQQRQLAASVLRQAVAEIVTPRQGQGLRFAGDRLGFAAESASSLAPGLGAAATPLRLRFVAERESMRLQAGNDESMASTYPWRLERAEIAYIGADGREHDRWPAVAPTVIPDDDADAVPAYVRFTLHFAGDDAPLVVIARPRASAWQIPEAIPPGVGQP